MNCSQCDISFEHFQDFHTHRSVVHGTLLPEVAIVTTPGKPAFDSNPAKVAIEREYFDNFIYGCGSQDIQNRLGNVNPLFGARKTFSKGGLPFFVAHLNFTDFLNPDVHGPMLRWQEDRALTHLHCVNELKAIARNVNFGIRPSSTPPIAPPSEFPTQNFETFVPIIWPSTSHAPSHASPSPPLPSPPLESCHGPRPSTRPLIDPSLPPSDPGSSPCPAPQPEPSSPHKPKDTELMGCRYSSALRTFHPRFKSHFQPYERSHRKSRRQEDACVRGAYGSAPQPSHFPLRLAFPPDSEESSPVIEFKQPVAGESSSWLNIVLC